MDCNQYKRAVLGEPLLLRPEHETLELRAHRESCQACREYAERALRFEARLQRALRVEVPVAGARAGATGRAAADGASAEAAAATVAAAEGTAAEGTAAEGTAAEGTAAEGTAADAAAVSSARVLPFRAKPRSAAATPPFSRTAWRALAASVLVAVGVAGALFISAPASSLAADVVSHMAGEPQAWRVTDVAVPDPALEVVLRDSHLRLGNGAGMVSYASSCAFRGHIVPHLVIQTAAGPVTVMVLVHESVAKAVPFDEQGYRGVIVPVPGHGSLAVLTRAPGAPGPGTESHAMESHAIEQIAARVEGAIVWTG